MKKMTKKANAIFTKGLLVVCTAVCTSTGAATQFPDLLRTESGRAVDGPKAWEEVRRAEVAKAILPIEYGTMPKEPADVRVVPVGEHQEIPWMPGVATRKFKVWCDMDGQEVSFVIQVWHGKDVKAETKLPVLLNGDGCWAYLSGEIVAAVVKRGWMLAHFNRCEVARDDQSSGDSTLLKWAWAYHRAIDALLKAEPRTDAGRIAITGHSRGGKTVELAAATDMRVFATGDNCSGCGGSAPYRDIPEGAETLAIITERFPYWFALGWASYAGKERELPFDQHFLAALIAPRKLFIRHAKDDRWANPDGAKELAEESRKVWALYGKEANLRYSLREGDHRHGCDDFMAFLDFAEERERP